MPEPLLTRYMQPLLAGRRAECFDLIDSAIGGGTEPETLIHNVVWPAMAQVERLYRDDRVNTAIEHMACRINRTIVDRLQSSLPRSSWIGKRILVLCADGPQEELGAQMVSDLFQSRGWEVYFLGSGVPDDEVLALVGQLRPQVLLIFGAAPEAVPDTRRLIDHLREIDVCPTMNIVVTGGIYNRAEGLWQEVGADAFCESAHGVLELTNNLRPREKGTQRVAVVKKRHRRRKAAALPA